MTINLAFGPVTLPANQEQDFGPYNVKAQDTLVVLTVDRTVPGGLDETPGAVIDITVSQSDDNGQTWSLFLSGSVVGGIQTYTDRQGTVHQFTQAVIQATLEQAKARLKVTVTVGSVPVAVAGTFVVT